MPQLPEEHVINCPMPGLGRIASFDPRDKEHRMSVANPLESTVTKRIWTYRGEPLDQGSTSECTAYSGEHWLMAGPVVQPMYLTPHRLYKLNQLWDEWEGENYEGSSVHATAKVLHRAGLISSYVWGSSIVSVRNWIMSRGPVLLGTDWYSGMTRPTASGFCRPRGTLQGGHAYLLIGADDYLRCPDGTRGAGIILNSWGRWGYLNSGRAFISYKDLDGLIKARGEACAAVEFLNIAPLNLEGVQPY